MKKWPKKLWIWILSGLGVILGSCSLFHRESPSCVYGPPKLYGPPSPESPYDLEELYGPPAPEVEPDSINENVEEPVEFEIEAPEDLNSND